jgi:hypothetical protein
MTRKIYKCILKLSNEMKNLDDSDCILVYKTSTILLDLIDNKNDIEFEMFFIERIINFRLNKSYYNSNNSDFYVELTDYLTTIKNKEETVLL